MRRTFVFAVTIVLLLAACRKPEVRSNAGSEPTPVAALVVTISAATLPITVPVTGTLVSNTRVDVKAEVIGHISRFDKEEGDPVRAGEPVAWVDDENSQLAQRQSETVVQVAEAGLERVRLMAS